jgi:Zn-finger in ubiquitin-hydrolases and other protein
MSAQEVCSHLDSVQVHDIPTRAGVPGCEECLKIGGRWVHLRVCRACGKVGCCDSSPNRHASRHAVEDSHPILSSIEPGEDWSWCVVDEVAFVLG